MSSRIRESEDLGFSEAFAVCCKLPLRKTKPTSISSGLLASLSVLTCFALELYLKAKPWKIYPGMQGVDLAPELYVTCVPQRDWGFSLVISRGADG